MNYAELKKATNEKALPLYTETIKQIKALYEEIKVCDGKFKELLQLIAEKILDADKFLNEFSADYYKQHTLEELKTLNKALSNEILPENYETSFANPEYAVAQ